ncbi:MAG TPA: hypothetical protein VGI60_05860 [Chthoniobacterales bacterium]|jgi:MYXO-CTERM domain-containing protein
MKTTLLKNRVVRIPTARWLAYASAGTATALTMASPAEAEIHYSGRVDVTFGTNDNKKVSFVLDQPGDSIVFARNAGSGGVDFFGARGVRSGAFLGSYPVFSYAYVWRIKNRDQNHYLSRGHFTNGGFGFGTSGTMVRGDRSSLNWRWLGKGTDFVGFRFNNGSGNQYGWARVHMDGPSTNFSFTVVDYAWADLGEPIRAGRTSSSILAAEPKEGSMGLLALGAAGLALWRNRRKS